MKIIKRSKKWMILASISLSTMVVLSACGEGEDEANEVNEANEDEQTEATIGEEAIIHTNMGEIHLELYPDAAPKAVENFLTLAEDGYYDGVIFHRVIENFMIQGGDPTGTGTGGESAFGGSFEDEFDDSVAHFNGALSMANSGPNTNSSQFFIVQARNNLNEEAFAAMEEQGLTFPEETIEKYLEVGGTPHLDAGHTVFGTVISGMDVVDSIATTATGAQDRPVEDVVIETVEVIN